MKNVLISIQPQWVKKIAEGKKTIEVRKSRPRLKIPFKCYIYCTQAKTQKQVLTYEQYCGFDMENYKDDFIANGKVIGEFICDHIYQYTTANHLDGTNITTEEMEVRSCLTYVELERYELSAEPKDFSVYLIGLYGWNISDLKIYDEPHELSELGIEKPPQSWRYVEEMAK